MRNYLKALLLPLVLLAGCASNGQPASIPINKSVVAAEDSVGVLASAAAVAVNVCLLDKSSSAGDIITKGLAAAGGTLDTANTNVQNGTVDGIPALIEIAKSALTNVSIALNGNQPSPAQTKAMHAATPKAAAGAKSLSTSEIIALVNQFLPIAIAGGTEIANLVKSFIDNIRHDNADVDAAAVAAANGAMHVSLNNYTAAACHQ